MVAWLNGYKTMIKKYLKLEDIKAYVISRELSKIVWEEVINWDHFGKKTIGDQFVRATDSIAANIAEGFGRYHKKDKIKFYYNARGSLYESLYWLELAYERNLIKNDTYESLLNKFNILPMEINYQIKITNEKLTI